MDALAPWAPRVRLPAGLDDLTEPERFVAWAFRHWIAGHKNGDPAHWSLVWNEFGKAFGAQNGKIALASLEALVRILCCHARRAIPFYPPCCNCLGFDEFCVITLVAACQGCRWHVAARQAEWLVAADGVGDLIAAGSRLAVAMAQCGHRLPCRSDRGSAGGHGDRRQGVAAGTLH